MIFGWPTFKIMCNPHFLSTLNVKLKTRWANTGSWEPLVKYYWPNLSCKLSYRMSVGHRAKSGCFNARCLIYLHFFILSTKFFMWTVIPKVGRALGKVWLFQCASYWQSANLFTFFFHIIDQIFFISSHISLIKKLVKLC